uniref:G_PROTEIN_RECEP_F1_2 domain-containing protein n=1 Tax=Caenorhabditis tropicalis TaxID=1561998 RepID=A0A1I7U3Z6_9PELO
MLSIVQNRLPVERGNTKNRRFSRGRQRTSRKGLRESKKKRSSSRGKTRLHSELHDANLFSHYSLPLSPCLPTLSIPILYLEMTILFRILCEAQSASRLVPIVALFLVRYFVIQFSTIEVMKPTIQG